MKLPESQLPGEDMARVRIKRVGEEEEEEWEGRKGGKRGEIRRGEKEGQMFILTCQQAEEDCFQKMFCFDLEMLLFLLPSKVIQDLP